ncbi:UNKNOWN [Stylonychia lemnae]|uniref:Methyltransferase type 11 domain-containing protein n=1 Tax=Stylonychia lemnae TaxID=5949 RepID=A0A078AB31_STYLE|nr:UNKNOWN [Stylonychia lemnae]|eukprot:CDW78817.1 UNKNOWN [Stylonychia lemnae]
MESTEAKITSQLQNINLTIQDEKSKFWDNFSSVYDQQVTRMATQPFITLCTQANTFQCKRILEVACGGGYHSLMVAKTMLSKGGALVSCDFSGKMMELTKQKYDDLNWSSGYTDVAGNKYYITSESLLPLGDHSFDLEEELKKHVENENDRFVFGCQANNESLPFKDDTFDCYLANLSLMLVDNHKNQLSEALRVCKKGTRFAFTVWGSEEKNNNFKILNMLIDKFKIGPAEKPVKTNFHISQNKEAVRQEMIEMGFSNIKMWFQPMNFPYQNFEEYWATIFGQPPAQAAMAKLDDEGRKQIKLEAEELYHQLLGEATLISTTRSPITNQTQNAFSFGQSSGNNPLLKQQAQPNDQQKITNPFGLLNQNQNRDCSSLKFQQKHRKAKEEIKKDQLKEQQKEVFGAQNQASDKQPSDIFIKGANNLDPFGKLDTSIDSFTVGNKKEEIQGQPDSTSFFGAKPLKQTQQIQPVQFCQGIQSSGFLGQKKQEVLINSNRVLLKISELRQIKMESTEAKITSQLQNINLTIQDEKSKFWDNFSSVYDQQVTRMATQPFITLCTQANTFQCKRILEVACGGGYHSLMVAKTMLQKGGALVSCDFSGKMMELTKQKYDDLNWSSGYTDVAGNKYYITSESLLPLGDHSFDLEEELKKHVENENDRFVFGCQANNESLPFKDDTFDCYLANLSLMLVDNHKNQLSEALRVCKKGTRFAFTVWGSEEKNNNFKILNMLIDKFKIGPAEKPVKTNFHISQNKEAVRQEMIEMGFSNIKMWFQPMNFPYQNFEEYWATIFGQPPAQAAMAKLDDEGRKQIKLEAEELYHQLLGEGALDPDCFEVMIIQPSTVQLGAQSQNQTQNAFSFGQSSGNNPLLKQQAQPNDQQKSTNPFALLNQNQSSLTNTTQSTGQIFGQSQIGAAQVQNSNNIFGKANEEIKKDQTQDQPKEQQKVLFGASDKQPSDIFDKGANNQDPFGKQSTLFTAGNKKEEIQGQPNSTNLFGAKPLTQTQQTQPVQFGQGIQSSGFLGQKQQEVDKTKQEQEQIQQQQQPKANLFQGSGLKFGMSQNQDKKEEIPPQNQDKQFNSVPSTIFQKPDAFMNNQQTSNQNKPQQISSGFGQPASQQQFQQFSAPQKQDKEEEEKKQSLQSMNKSPFDKSTILNQNQKQDAQMTNFSSQNSANQTDAQNQRQDKFSDESLNFGVKVKCNCSGTNFNQDKKQAPLAFDYSNQYELLIGGLGDRGIESNILQNSQQEMKQFNVTNQRKADFQRELQSYLAYFYQVQNRKVLNHFQIAESYQVI